MNEWAFDVPTSGSTRLAPDPRYIDALSSQGYGFGEAVADLIDNSIDAGATQVVVHFLRDGDHLVSLIIVDDGDGMTPDQLRTAMTVGGQREYTSHDLGMFGTGLKAASFSHADSLTVITRTTQTAATGLRWQAEKAKHDFQCDVVDSSFAQDFLQRYWDAPIRWHGTIVRWDGVHDFPKFGDPAQTNTYLHATFRSLADHLGLYLHRFLATKRVGITLAVEDIQTTDQPATWRVEPLDPFGYPISGSPDYPKTFAAELPSIDPIPLVAHVWTPRSPLPQFRLQGGALRNQGFFFYRRDRLVQAGGWNDIRQPEQHLSLARIALDLPTNGATDQFRLTVKKAGVRTSPAFASAVMSARSPDGQLFSSYLRVAEFTYREARTKTRERKPVLPMGKGFAPNVKSTLEEEVPLLPGEVPVEIRWDRLEDDQFFELDLDGHRITINSSYRQAILGGRRGGLNDAPTLKAALFLLLANAFEAERLGSRQKDNLSYYQNLLVAAARSEG